MTTENGRVVVRSYRTVFRFERRLYRFDRWRLPVRGGVPLRALVYTPAVYLALIAVARIPGVGWGIQALPDPVRWGLLPLALVVVLLRLELDGRPAHRALWAIVRWRLGPKWRAGLRPWRAPGPALLAVGVLVIRPDWRRPRCAAGCVRGPARVRLGGAAVDGIGDRSGASRVAGRRLVVPRDGSASNVARVIDVPAGGVLELR